MDNSNIILEWIPSIYKRDAKAGQKTEVKMPAVKTTLYAGKGIYIKQGFKRKSIK
jgi:hypothetical protein